MNFDLLASALTEHAEIEFKGRNEEGLERKRKGTNLSFLEDNPQFRKTIPQDLSAIQMINLDMSQTMDASLIDMMIDSRPHAGTAAPGPNSQNSKFLGLSNIGGIGMGAPRQRGDAERALTSGAGFGAIKKLETSGGSSNNNSAIIQNDSGIEDGEIHIAIDGNIGDFNIIRKNLGNILEDEMDVDNNFDEFQGNESGENDESKEDSAGEDEETHEDSSEVRSLTDYSFSEDEENTDAMQSLDEITLKYVDKITENKIKDVFSEQVKCDFTLNRELYEKEVALVKQRVAKFSIDVKKFYELGEQKPMPDTRFKTIFKGFYEATLARFGQPSCIAVNKGFDFMVMGTERCEIVFYGIKSQQLIQFRPKNASKKLKAVPSVIRIKDKTKDILVGFESGYIQIIHYNLERFEFVPWMKCTKTGGWRILDIAALGTRFTGLVYLNTRFDLRYSTRFGKAGKSTFEFKTVEVDIMKNTTPHMQEAIVQKVQFLVVTSADQAYLFLHRRKRSFKQTLLGEEVVYTHELVPFKTVHAPFPTKCRNFETEPFKRTNVEDYRESFPIFVRGIAVAEKEGAQPKLKDVLCIVWGNHIAYYDIQTDLDDDDQDSDLRADSTTESRRTSIFSMKGSRLKPQDPFAINDDGVTVAEDFISYGGVVELDCKVVYAGVFRRGLIIMMDTDCHLHIYNVRKHMETPVEEVKRRATTNLLLSKIIRQVVLVASEVQDISIGGSATTLPSMGQIQQVKTKKCKNARYDPQKIQEIVAKVNTKLNYEDVIHGMDSYDRVPKYSGLMSSNSSQFLVLTRKGLSVFEVMRWNEFLEECSKKGFHLFALKTVRDIMRGAPTGLRLVPEKQKALLTIGPQAQMVIQHFVPSMKGMSFKDSKMVTEICVYIQIRLGIFEFLNEGFCRLMYENGFRVLYLETIMIFYERQLIPVLDQERVSDIIDHLTSVDESRNGTTFFRKRFLKTVYKKRQHEQLCIANAIKHEDFYLLVHFVVEYNSEAALIPIETFKLKIDTIKQRGEEGAAAGRETLEDCMVWLYWYVYEHTCGCFSREMVRESEKRFNLTAHTLKILGWMLEERPINWLLKLDAVFYFRFLLLAVRNGLVNIFKQIPPKTFRVSKEEYAIEGGPLGIFTADSEPHVSYLLELVYSRAKQDGFLTLFFLFIAGLTFAEVEGIELSILYKREALKDLVLNYVDIINAEILNEEEALILIMKFFRHVKKAVKGDREIERVLKNADWKLQVIYHELREDLRSTFQFFERNILENPAYKRRMYCWIKDGLETEDEKEGMIRLVEKEFNFLIIKDHKQFMECLEKVPIDKQMNFALKYDKTTKPKYLLFKKIIKFLQDTKRTSQMTPAFKVEYLRLMNEYEKFKVIDELKRGRYPPIECLEVCEEAENELPIAYLKERLGKYEEALSIYKKRLRKCMRALIKGNRIETPEKAAKLKERIIQESKAALSLCRDATTENPTKLKIGFLDFLAEVSEKYNDQEIPEWTQLTKELLTLVLETIDPKHLIQAIGEDEGHIVNSKITMKKITSHFKALKKIFSKSAGINDNDAFRDTILFILGLKRAAPLRYVYGKKVMSVKGDCLIMFNSCRHYFNIMHEEEQANKEAIFCSKCEKQNEQLRIKKRLDRFVNRQKVFIYPEELEASPQTMVQRRKMFEDQKIEEEKAEVVNLHQKRLDTMGNYDQYATDNFFFHDPLDLKQPTKMYQRVNPPGPGGSRRGSVKRKQPGRAAGRRGGGSAMDRNGTWFDKWKSQRVKGSTSGRNSQRGSIMNTSS